MLPKEIDNDDGDQIEGRTHALVKRGPLPLGVDWPGPFGTQTHLRY